MPRLADLTWRSCAQYNKQLRGSGFCFLAFVCLAGLAFFYSLAWQNDRPAGLIYVAEDYSEIYGNFGLDAFRKNWFTENANSEGDFSLSLEVGNIIHRERSKYQDILIFDSKKFGRCLALDNALQCTEKDEFSYHEMMAFIPLNSHHDPKKVLIIGGGDGGITREVAKHPSVQSIVQCEIDEAVMNVCRQYLPSLAKGLDNPKVNVITDDGIEYLKNKKNEFDVIITDSSGPIGPAVQLYEKPYLQLLKEALRPGGVIQCQGEGFWFDRHLLRDYLDICRSIFPVVDYAATFMVSYAGGHNGFLLAGISKDTNFRKPIQIFSTQTLKDLELRYYTPDVHRAAFCLPLYIMRGHTKVLDYRSEACEE